MSGWSKKFCKFPKDKAAARVAVAKDVIEWILSEKMFAGHVGYVGNTDWTGNVSVELEPTFESVAENCKVCAMGACLLGALKRFDGNGFAVFLESGIDGAEVVYQLRGLFSEKQLRLMEAAYEGFIDEKYEANFDKFIDSNDCLLAIMQNIVDHKGTFKPEVEYEIVNGGEK